MVINTGNTHSLYLIIKFTNIGLSPVTTFTYEDN